MRPFPRLCSNLSLRLLSEKLPERPTAKTLLCVLLIAQLHVWTICLHSIKSSLPSLYPLRHLRNKLFQTLSRSSILQATESLAGPGSEASCKVWVLIQEDGFAFGSLVVSHCFLGRVSPTAIQHWFGRVAPPFGMKTAKMMQDFTYFCNLDVNHKLLLIIIHN